MPMPKLPPPRFDRISAHLCAAITEATRPHTLRPGSAGASRTANRRYQQQRVLCAAAFVLALGSSFPVRADEAEGHYRIGLDYKRKGDVPHALAEIRMALSLRPDHAAAHMSLGSLLLDTNTYPEALNSFERAIVLSPQHAPAYALAGVTLLRMKRYEAAIPRLRKAIELDPQDAQSVSNLGVALRQLNRNGEAIARGGNRRGFRRTRFCGRRPALIGDITNAAECRRCNGAETSDCHTDHNAPPFAAALKQGDEFITAAHCSNQPARRLQKCVRFCA